MVVPSKVPNLPLKISFLSDADMLVVSSCFMLYPIYLSIFVEPIIGALCDPSLLEPYISLSRIMLRKEDDIHKVP